MTIQAEDPDGDLLGYGVETLPENATLQGAAFHWIPRAVQAGSHTAVFFVQPAGGTAQADQADDTLSVTLNVVQPNRSPSLDDIPSGLGQVGEPKTLFKFRISSAILQKLRLRSSSTAALQMSLPRSSQASIPLMEPC